MALDLFAQFNLDLASAQKTEQMVADILQKLNSCLVVENLSSDKEYYHKGDLRVTDLRAR